MKKVKKWIQSHLICLWVVSSVLFAIIIHILFSLHISNEWWSAKWSAGDILTYVSTVALGLLAVWQNKKFKEESDISQERMEKLTKQANELSAIGKIVEYETENILQEIPRMLIHPHRTSGRDCHYCYSGGIAASGAAEGAGSRQPDQLHQQTQTAGHGLQRIFCRQFRILHHADL